MAEYPHDIIDEIQHVDTLPSGNEVLINQNEIRAFLDASFLDTDTHFAIRTKPYHRSPFTDIQIAGHDISSRQSQAIELVALFDLPEGTNREQMMEKIRTFLEGSFEEGDNEPICDFEFYADELILSIDSPSRQRYFLYPDTEDPNMLIMVNSGSVTFANSAPENFVTTKPDSFGTVDATSQIIDFCVALTEFLEIVDSANAMQKRKYIRKRCKFEYYLQGYAKNLLSDTDHVSPKLALDIGHTAITDGGKALQMPAQELIDEDFNKIRFKDIAGYDEQKKDILVSLAVHQNPHLATRYGLTPSRGILLYGPPGTGKTTLAEACATEMGAKVIKITSEFYAKYVGESTSNLAKFFDDAERATEPVVLLLDELDGIVHGSGNSGVDKGVLGLFKQKLASITNPNVLVIATTNNKDAIEESILRSGRFDIKLYIPLPNASDRMAIFAKYIADGSGRSFVSATTDEIESDPVATNDYYELFDSTVDTNALTGLTDGFSGADIKNIIDQAKRQKLYEEIETGECSLITQEDLLSAIRAFKQS